MLLDVVVMKGQETWSSLGGMGPVQTRPCGVALMWLVNSFVQPLLLEALHIANETGDAGAENTS